MFSVADASRISSTTHLAEEKARELAQRKASEERALSIRRNLVDGRNDAKSGIKVLDVVELMAASMGLDMTIPENPYTKFQEQDVLVCGPAECKLDTVERQAPGKDEVGEAH